MTPSPWGSGWAPLAGYPRRLLRGGGRLCLRSKDRAVGRGVSLKPHSEATTDTNSSLHQEFQRLPGVPSSLAAVTGPRP